MKWIKALAVAAVSVSLVAGTSALADPKPAPAGQNADKKLTCCQKADAAGKECSNKCCVAAHRQGKSCDKCNPNKEDLAILKKRQKEAKK